MLMGFLATISSAINGAEQIVRTYNNVRANYDTLVSAFDNSDVGMFYQSGMTLNEYKKALLDTKVNIEKLQHSDVFKVEISRVAPYYDIQKSRIITSMMKSVSVVYDGLETQEDKVGTGYINWHKTKTSGEIQAVFHEFQDGSVVDFLTRVSPLNALSGAIDEVGIGGAIRGVEYKINQGLNTYNAISGALNSIAGTNFKSAGSSITGILGLDGLLGNGSSPMNNKHGNIMPSDGTTLLPYEYYFRIKISNMRADLASNSVYETVVLDDDYILDGNVSEDRSTGDEAYLEVNATFKPIKSWR